jgi:rRNA maturation RNase YbeY
LNGDIFISADQVRLNTEIYQVPLRNELKRVAIHGVLHLLGYNDQSEDEKRAMRILEDKYLCRFN